MHRVIAGLCILFSIITLYANDDASEATLIAEKGFKKFISSCLSGDAQAYKHFNLGDRDVIEKATLGKPYKLGLISPEKVRTYRSNTKVCDCYKTINTYIFPVLFNGKTKFVLSVEKYTDEGNYKIGSIGSKWLALEIEKVLKKWPSSKGYSIVLMQNLPTQEYAFHIPQKDGFNLTLLSYDVNRNENSYLSLSTIDDVMGFLNTSLDKFAIEGGK